MLQAASINTSQCDHVVTAEKFGFCYETEEALSHCNIRVRMVGDERLELPTSSV
jgi:hypothetical protein